MKTIIFLGGIPGSGKTTLAYHLASIYKIDKVISLDVLKNVLKEFITEENEPYIYTTTHEAYKIENLSILDGFIKHTKVINSYFQKLIKRFNNEKFLIVEGATITKEFLSYFENYNVIYFNLYVEESDELIKRYQAKMRNRKGEWINNLDNILLINEYLKKQADFNINVKTVNETLKIMKEYIYESIFL